MPSRSRSTGRRPAARCEECARAIAVGETYVFLVGLYDGQWSTYRWCLHCEAAGAWMWRVCGGYPLGMLREELQEHWHEGYRSVAFGRLVVGVRRGWLGGRAAVPDKDEVRSLADEMMHRAVAA